MEVTGLEKIMKKIQKDKTSQTVVAEMRDEYRLDYAKARPNRFADRMEKCGGGCTRSRCGGSIRHPETVNKVLRALIGAMPNIAKLKPGEKSTA